MKVAKDEVNSYLDTQTLYGSPSDSDSKSNSNSNTTENEILVDNDGKENKKKSKMDEYEVVYGVPDSNFYNNQNSDKNETIDFDEYTQRNGGKNQAYSERDDQILYGTPQDYKPKEDNTPMIFANVLISVALLVLGILAIVNKKLSKPAKVFCLIGIIALGVILIYFVNNLSVFTP